MSRITGYVRDTTEERDLSEVCGSMRTYSRDLAQYNPYRLRIIGCWSKTRKRRVGADISRNWTRSTIKAEWTEDWPRQAALGCPPVQSVERCACVQATWPLVWRPRPLCAHRPTPAPDPTSTRSTCSQQSAIKSLIPTPTVDHSRWDRSSPKFIWLCVCLSVFPR